MDPAMSLFSEIEKTIERGFHRWAERMFGPADSDELLLVHRAILEEIEGKVQIVARGQRVFPYRARDGDAGRPPTPTAAPLYQAAFGEDGRLENDIREALEGAQCEVPRGFAVEVQTAESGRGDTFAIEYGGRAREERAGRRAARRSRRPR